MFMQRPEGLGEETWGIRGEERRHDVEASARGSPLCPRVQPGDGMEGCGDHGMGDVEARELQSCIPWPGTPGDSGCSSESGQGSQQRSSSSDLGSTGPLAAVGRQMWGDQGRSRALGGGVQGGTAQLSGGAGADAHVGKAPKTVPCSLSQALALTDQCPDASPHRR